MRFTLSDLTNADNLAQWLGMSEDELRAAYLIANPFEPSWYGRTAKPMADSAEFQRMTLGDLAKWWVKHNRSEGKLRYPFGDRSYSAFLNECASALGIKKGSVEARRAALIAARPDVYAAPEPPPASPISWMHGRQPSAMALVAVDVAAHSGV